MAASNAACSARRRAISSAAEGVAPRQRRDQLGTREVEDIARLGERAAGFEVSPDAKPHRTRGCDERLSSLGQRVEGERMRSRGREHRPKALDGVATRRGARLGIELGLDRVTLCNESPLCVQRARRVLQLRRRADATSDHGAILAPRRHVLAPAGGRVAKLLARAVESLHVDTLPAGRAEGRREPAALAAQQPAQLPHRDRPARVPRGSGRDQRSCVLAAPLAEVGHERLGERRGRLLGRAKDVATHTLRDRHPLVDAGAERDSPPTLAGRARLEAVQRRGKRLKARQPLRAQSITVVRGSVTPTVGGVLVAEVQVAADRDPLRAEDAGVELGDQRRVGLRVALAGEAPAVCRQGGIRQLERDIDAHRRSGLPATIGRCTCARAMLMPPAVQRERQRASATPAVIPSQRVS